MYNIQNIYKIWYIIYISHSPAQLGKQRNGNPRSWIWDPRETDSISLIEEP